MDIDQSLEKECRQVLEWQRRVDAKPDGVGHSQLISAVVEGIIPVIKKHVLREIAKGTESLKRRVLELEIKQRRKVGPVKAIGRRRPVKCMF